MASVEEKTEDLTGNSWKNQPWLDTYPLDSKSVISYFAESIFYDPKCNNELARKQFMDPTRISSLPPGVEYVVTDSQEPHLFIICKQERTSSLETKPQAFYYVLDGTVYQAPTLHQVLSSRMERCKWSMRAAFSKMKAHLDPLLTVLKEDAGGRKEPEGDSAAEAEAAAPEASPRVSARPLTAQEREHAVKVDSIIMNVLRQNPLKGTPHTTPGATPAGGATPPPMPGAGGNTPQQPAASLKRPLQGDAKENGAEEKDAKRLKA